MRARHIRLFLGALVSALALPAIAHADPITAAVVTWATSIGVNAAVATFVVNTAISVATAASRDRATPPKGDV